eukprot:TRINITY_DN8102_c2_g1_i1.p1 TRINITY_DN8102_c2_g1~~TRINITY_DN8102_c2_g1_i1.p1  ORF type:complete len:266 (-),score=63.28 TRINITY_DN8102_c2_g1_i1:428-1159(-)
MMFSVDTKGCLTEWSDDAQQLTGFVRREVLGLPLAELVTVPFRELVDDMMAVARNGVVGQPVRMPFFDKAGDSFEILLSASSCEQKAGHLVLACLLVEEGKADAQLLSPDADVSIDERGRVTDWSVEAEESTVFMREEVMGMQFLDFITSPHRESVAQMLRQAACAKAVRPLEVPFYTKAGEELAVLLTCRSIKGRAFLQGKFVEADRCECEAPAWDSCLSKGKPNIWNCDTCDSLTGVLSSL